MLEVRNLSKIYKTKNGTDVKALDNVSLSIKEASLSPLYFTTFSLMSTPLPS